MGSDNVFETLRNHFTMGACAIMLFLMGSMLSLCAGMVIFHRMDMALCLLIEMRVMKKIWFALKDAKINVGDEINKFFTPHITS